MSLNSNLGGNLGGNFVFMQITDSLDAMSIILDVSKVKTITLLLNRNNSHGGCSIYGASSLTKQWNPPSSETKLNDNAGQFTDRTVILDVSS